MGCKNQFALHLRVVQLTFSTTNIQPSPVVPMLSQPQSHPTMLINLPLKSQILTGMLAMRCDARPASSILGSAAPVASYFTTSPLSPWLRAWPGSNKSQEGAGTAETSSHWMGLGTKKFSNSSELATWTKQQILAACAHKV